MTTKVKILLLIILFLALGLRVYKLDSIPPSISWDEAAVGYNGWVIANYGRDEYGKFFPIYFRSFADDKHPVHIYITALSEKLLGLNEFATRFPSAIFGTLNVLLIFLLARQLFNNQFIGLSAALFLAISPYNIHFSRFNHEANFALFFLMLGLLFFYYSFRKGYFLPFSLLSFAICFITYHPSKVIVSVLLITLLTLYIQRILKNRKNLAISLLVGLFFAIVIILNPQLLGIARVGQTSLGKEAVEKTKLFQLTRNELLGRIHLTAIQYSWHFTQEYLFIIGDKNPRLSSQTGEFYKIDAIFLFLGLLYLIYKRSKPSLILLTWAFVAPLPSALVAEAPHAARAMFMMGSWHLISAAGLYFVINIVRKPIFKYVLVASVLVTLSYYLFNYLNYYYGEYAKRYAIEWQYGMKQIVEFVGEHPEYNQVFMTDVRSQPYIFFLYYLKLPLKEYLNNVIYNNNLENRSYNTVANFGRFYFGGWDPIESFPNTGVLYVVTPSQYDGLRHKSLFNVKKLVYYPNGLTAFYLVSIN